MSRNPVKPISQLGKWLQDWRRAEKRSLGVGHRKKFFTQTDAAQYFGLPFRTYQEIESGRSPGTKFTRTKLTQIVKPKTD